MLLQLTSGILFLMLSSPLLAERPSLNIATSQYPPFEYLEEGKLVGEDVETIQNVVERMGMEPSFVVLPWIRAEARVRSGKSDLLFTLTRSKQRERHYYFTDPINTARDVFFKRSGMEFEWQTFDDLEGMRVGLSSSYSYAPEFMAWLDTANVEAIRISQERPDLTGLRMLAFDRIDLFICEHSVCSFLLKKHQGTQTELKTIEAVPGTIGKERAFRAAFSRQNPEGEQLRDRFNQALAELRQESID